MPNLLFEICNEPNGETDWSDILEYCDEVIPVIRGQIPEAVILVGTPEFDRNLGSAVLRPVPYDNVMTVLHFYASTHGVGLLDELEAAIDSGLPVFITECGISEANGDGDLNFAMAARWFDYLHQNSISYAIWSLSDKNESSAMFRPGFEPEEPIRDSDLTVCGRWVKALISGEDPQSIPYPADTLEKGRLSRIWTFLSSALGERGTRTMGSWPVFAGIGAFVILLFAGAGRIMSRAEKRKTVPTMYFSAAKTEVEKSADEGAGTGGERADTQYPLHSDLSVLACPLFYSERVRLFSCCRKYHIAGS